MENDTLAPGLVTLQSPSLDALIPALIKAQGTFTPAIKDSTNPHFKSKYVGLDGVLDAIAAPLRDQGIALVQQTYMQDALTILHTRLIHTSGQWIGSHYPVHPIKADPQGEGSALTYARRYSVMALVCIAPEDDDGNAATARAHKDAAALIAKIEPRIKAADANELPDIGREIARAQIDEEAKTYLRDVYRDRQAELAA